MIHESCQSSEAWLCEFSTPLPRSYDGPWGLGDVNIFLGPKNMEDGIRVLYQRNITITICNSTVTEQPCRDAPLGGDDGERGQEFREITC